MNACSGRGECISLGQAAALNDGFLFNRTTKYAQWDANTIFWCRCDPGFTGADCSQRVCPSGVDPRLTSFKYETVTLVCDCRNAGACSGKFKFQFYGVQTQTWLSSSSLAYQVILKGL